MHKGVNLPTKTIVVEQLHMILVDFFRNLYSEHSKLYFTLKVSLVASNRSEHVQALPQQTGNDWNSLIGQCVIGKLRQSKKP